MIPKWVAWNTSSKTKILVLNLLNRENRENFATFVGRPYLTMRTAYSTTHQKLLRNAIDKIYSNKLSRIKLVNSYI